MIRNKDLSNSKKRNVINSLSITGLIEAVFALFVMCNIVGYFGGYAWFLELFAHFKFQYFIVSIIFIGFFLLMKKWKLLIITVLIMSVNIFHIAPFYINLSKTDNNIIDSSKISIVLLNVHTDNDNYQGVVEYIQSKNPDIFVLQEINVDWLIETKNLWENYEYRVARPRDDNFGIGLFSNIPFEDTRVEFYSNSEVPSIVAEIIVNEKPVSILCTHPLPPIDREYYDIRNNQLREIASKRSEFSDSLIVIGDLNTTSWTSIFREFVRDMDLYDSRLGKGLQPTWPSPVPFFKIPIDHCLISKDIITINREIGPDLGSDHRPVYIELGFN
ncbi:UNVERIFIED_CONTAM: endonuclease/exonuclease/phosphatase (EEP) superfamily protein YafD [Acetivibrio alkalicellulosi]